MYADALLLLFELADREDERFQLAAARWHARFVLEAGLPLREAEGVMTLLCRLRGADRLVVRRRLLATGRAGRPDDEGDPLRCVTWRSRRGDAAMPDYRYELRRGDEVIATGHLSREQLLEVGDRITIGSRTGIVRDVEPLLGEHELRLVVQLTRDEFSD